MKSPICKNLFPKAIIFLVFISSQILAFAQPDAEQKPKKKWPAVVTKLSDCGLPEEMVKRIRSMTKADMDSIRGEDYHENTLEDDGEEYVTKVMLRFIDGNIIGFVKKEPLMQSNRGEYIRTTIEIPIVWCGLDSLKQEHCVTKPEEMDSLAGDIKPKDWHQKPDPGDMAGQDVAEGMHLQLLDGRRSKKKNKEALSDSAIASVTKGLTGVDSLNAVKQYEASLNTKKSSKKKKKPGELSQDVIDSVTKGLTGVDSINAIKEYQMNLKLNKLNPAPPKQESVVLTTDSSASPSSPIPPAPPPAAKSRRDRKKKKGEQVVVMPPADSSAAPVSPAPAAPVPSTTTDSSAAPVAPAAPAPVAPTPPPTKDSSASPVVPATPAPATDSSVATQPVAPAATNNTDTSASKAALPPASKDSTAVAPPDVPVEKKSRRKKIRAEVPPPPPVADTATSTPIVAPIVPTDSTKTAIDSTKAPVDSTKAPVDSTKKN